MLVGGFQLAMKISFNLTRVNRVFPSSWIPDASFLKEFGLFAMSTIIYLGGRFGVDIYAARLMGPTEYGLWNLLSLVPVYGTIIQFGVLNGMNREVPYFFGAKEPERVQIIRHTTYTVVVGTALVAFIALMVAGILIPDSKIGFPLLLLSGGLLFAQQIYLYFQIYLKSAKHFILISAQQLLFVPILVLIALPTTILWGLSGYIAALTFSMILTSIWIAKRIEHRNQFNVDWQEARHLAKIGFPIMVTGLLYGLLTSVDRWVIVTFLGTTQLGYYTLAIITLRMITMFPLVISQQIYPRLAEAYGASRDITKLKSLLVQQLALSVVIMAPLVIGIYFFFPPLITRFLSEYAPGIDSMRVTLLGVVFLPLSSALGNLLIIIGKQNYPMFAQAAAIVANVVAGTFFANIGWGIRGVAVGSAFSYFVYAALLVAVVLRVVRKEGAFRRLSGSI